MNILFYASSTNEYDSQNIERLRFPLITQDWMQLASLHPEHNFFIVTQLPSPFLTDTNDPDSHSYDNYIGIEQTLSPNLYKKILPQMPPKEFVNQIMTFNPQICVSATFWITPFDWLPFNDSMIAEELEKEGIKTFCHPSEAAFICFDKVRTHLFLKQNGFFAPNAVYINHLQYWSERPHKEIKHNAYKAYSLAKISKMTFPVIIKDTVGLSSYSMEVAVSFKQALAYLNSGRSSTDRIVEEFMQGIQFGTEIYGFPGNYYVMPPFMFSVNRYGITSPKQCIKLGPVTSPYFRIDELNKMLISLANKMKLKGVAQVDLVFTKEGWRIIEINPRLSGMSETYAISLNTTVPELLFEIVHAYYSDKPFTLEAKKINHTINLKLPILNLSQIKKMSQLPFVKCTRQIFNKIARQEREKGYCEIIFSSEKSLDDLEDKLNFLYKEFPESTEKDFFKTAKEMIALIRSN